MTKMETGNVFQQMKKYDFSTPINVTMIFDESDNEDDVPKINEKNLDDCFIVENNTVIDTEENNCSKSRNHRKRSSEESKFEYNSSSDAIKNIKPNLRLVANENNDHKNNNSAEVTGKNGQTIVEKNLSAYTKALLNTLSEHLRIIIHRHRNTARNRIPVHIKQYNKLKTHFFDLSYSTAITLLIPQEKNEKFINSFIEKVVTDANKVFSVKCDRQEVLQVYNELLQWAKVKRSVVKNLSLQQDADNNNKLLKEQLNNPPLPPFSTINISKPEASLQNRESGRSINTENSSCIFSHGPPDQEIRISINYDTLSHHVRENEQFINQTIETPPNINNNYPVNPLRITRKTTHLQSRICNVSHNFNPKNTNYFIQQKPQGAPPPPYYNFQARNNSARRPDSHNIYINQNQENTTGSMQNYYQHGIRQIERQPAPTPINTYCDTGPCSVCAKVTNGKCSNCHKLYYCCMLCQDLHLGIHKPFCK